MDLPDCPPGAEGYEDSVIEMPKRPDDTTCTKAEQEFQDHLNSLKIKLEDGTHRPMVGRSARDSSGKWAYLCYPCAAVCSGESNLQTHMLGKKHKNKISAVEAWPVNICEEHPYNQIMKQTPVSDKVQKIQKIEVDWSNKNAAELESILEKYSTTPCQLQEKLDEVKTPLLGLEYLIEFAPEQAHYEPKYTCTLCSKQGHPRTILNHMTCFWHRYNYILRHFPRACHLLTPYRGLPKFREGVGIVINRLVQRIEDTYGRRRPLHMDKMEYDNNKNRIHRWIVNSPHFSEKEGATFEEVVDIGLINSLHQEDSNPKDDIVEIKDETPDDPSPPKPHFNHFSRPAGRQERRVDSVESLSDISDDFDAELRRDVQKIDRQISIDARSRDSPPLRHHRYTNKKLNSTSTEKPRNYEYKLKLVTEKHKNAEEAAKKTLAYHEKNPEKHPLYPEEWKKFWNKRYKEIQAEGKDPAKHDYKPEWIVFWTNRMKELHIEELRVTVTEIYRKLGLPPPGSLGRSESAGSRHEDDQRPEKRRRSPELSRERRRSPDGRRVSPGERRHSPDARRHSPDARRHSPDARRRSPEVRRREAPEARRSPGPGRGAADARFRSPGRHRSPQRYRSPVRQRSPMRQRSPPRNRYRDIKRDRRSPVPRPIPGRDSRRRSQDRHLVPHRRSRSRSPVRRHSPGRARYPAEAERRSRSPLSQRDVQPRNRSPEHRSLAPSMQTVLISDDELKGDDGLSPWNSDNEIGSVGSSSTRRHKSARAPEPAAQAPDDVVATLRLLVALEDYLGSLGPKLVDLLAEALKMEKERANSSEELLERESALVLMETAKEKLKGAAQAGLVAGSAAAAVRVAVVRAAATLHEADKRAKRRPHPQPVTSSASGKSAVPVAGVGEVDRAQIAQQMAEALIAQGKTDVSSEELAQLVEAVVGMAEAKKREAEKRQPEIKAAPPLLPNPPSAAAQKMSGTASALQMLQSAYDENDKRAEKEDAPDAMDGLSDSDLETLLKNFNELSAEEQHSLIAYLKKLEAREPARVERLRQYVSAAATAEPPPAPSNHTASVVIAESDDDDYTVEEVIQSATIKVKENQRRQEMEIVRQSLKESATPPLATSVSAPGSSAPIPSASAIADITRSLSTATDLFALVQASIKSTPALAPATITQNPEVVASSTQPRSFGDLPEASATQEQAKSTASLIPSLVSTISQSTPLLRNPPQTFMENNALSDIFSQGNSSSNKTPSDPFVAGNNRFNRESQLPQDNFNQDNDRFARDNPPPSGRFNSGNQLPNDHFNQGNQPSNDRFNQGNLPPSDRFNQGNQLSNDRLNQDSLPPGDRFNPGNPPPNDRFNQVNPGGRFNRGNLPPSDRSNQGIPPPNDRFNRGNHPENNRFNQDVDRYNQQPYDRYNLSNPPVNDRFSQSNQLPSQHFNQDHQPPSNRFNQGNQPSNDNFNPGNQLPKANFNIGNAKPSDHFIQGNQLSNNSFNVGKQQHSEVYQPSGQQPLDRFNQGNQLPSEHYNQSNQPSNVRFNPGTQPPNDRFNQGNMPRNDRFNQGNQPLSEPLIQENPPQGNLHNQWPARPTNMIIENKIPLIRAPNPRPLLSLPNNMGPGLHNQDHRPNFAVGLGHEMIDQRPYDQQYGNSFRGRGGRGHHGGPMRGRGRGYY